MSTAAARHQVRGQRDPAMENPGTLSISLLCQDRSGAVGIALAVALGTIALVSGLAIDFGRWAHARSETIAALDAAVLAGGRALQLGSSRDDAIAVAETYYAQNLEHRGTVQDDTIRFSVTEGGLSLAAQGNVTLATPFLGLTGRTSISLLSARHGQQTAAHLAVGRYAHENLEVALILDVSAELQGEKLAALKDAASDFIRLLVWDDQTTFQSRVALVPFASAVRPPPELLETVRGIPPQIVTARSPYGIGQAFYRLTDCVAERAGDQAFTDAAPGSGQMFLPVYHITGACAAAAGATVHPLTSDRQLLLSAIDALDAAGSAAGHLGIAWAGYVLSPEWAGLWDSASSAAAEYSDSTTRKIAVFLTASSFTTQYGAEGTEVPPELAVNGSSWQQTAALCQQMKQRGVEIFTIAYDLSEELPGSEALAACASDPASAHRPRNATELRMAFRAIAVDAIDIYLSN